MSIPLAFTEKTLTLDQQKHLDTILNKTFLDFKYILNVLKQIS